MTILYSKGCDVELNATDESQIHEAVELAKSSEAVVLCLGEHQFDNGECKSKTKLHLPSIQYKLLSEVLKVNKNVAVLLFTGRPLAIEELNNTAPAILNMWMPGTEGGNAASNLIFARSIPSGKLTISFPRTVGQCPIYYNYYNTGRPKLNDDDNTGYTSCYIDSQNRPLYPFGYGLSYTTFEYSDRKIDKAKMSEGEKIIASVKVKNTGKYKAKETVRLYIRDLFGSVVRPVKELKGYEKNELEPNEEKSVTFEITEDALAFYGTDIQKKAEKGKFQIFIASNSQCEPFAEFELI
ncbi:MAG: glycoside hydrolase family 3 C-terminal domain-containing protein [Clostridia bacterium]|nr:glycoside hydrolase family 3 C-terminal domain-containing protein [Clostridia bacterium]